MTTLAINHFLSRAPALLHKINAAVSAFFDGIDNARQLSQRFETLSRLSDTELAQHGLKRTDIPRIVLNGGRA